jgi:hypothetical protein
MLNTSTSAGNKWIQIEVFVPDGDTRTASANLRALGVHVEALFELAGIIKGRVREAGLWRLQQTPGLLIELGKTGVAWLARSFAAAYVSPPGVFLQTHNPDPRHIPSTPFACLQNRASFITRIGQFSLARTRRKVKIATYMRGALSSVGSAVLDWYWQHGAQRTGEFDLSGAWLDQLYQLRDTAMRVEEALAAGRPCLALWGPSQSGKSTLLSRYLDEPAAADASSALQWSADEAVVFVGRADQPGAIHLNPYNQQRDASGCVTRFTLRREVAFPAHPVELKLASEGQLLHALASGYLMECDTRAAGSRETYHEPASIEKKLAELREIHRPKTIPSRPVRETLQILLDVLDDLIAADWPRYRNLRPDWRSLRPRLGSEPILKSDALALAEFAAWLFWDSQTVLTDLWQQLQQARKRTLMLAGGRPIFCSYSAARIFLDIDAFRKIDQGQGNEAVRISELRCGVADSGFLIGTGLPNPLFADHRDFGLFQALVWEMTVPVNAALLPADSAAMRLLNTADLLDFPGVALTYPGGERKPVDQMTPVQLLTEVVKRGKTASIVITRSRQLGIDGFSILNRIQAPPAQPTQLLTGIQAWVQALGQPWPPAPDALPINLVLTFAARLVNGVVDSVQLRRPSADFSPVFEFLNKLGDLANPRWVRFFTTTYPRFDEGCVRGSPQDLEEALRLISASPDFQRHLGPCLASLTAMVNGGKDGGDGGNDFFLEALTRQARQSQTSVLLRRRGEELHHQFLGLLAEALPPEVTGEQRRAQELEDWGRAIESAIAARRRERPASDAASQVSHRLRTLVDVSPELLEPIPLASQGPDWRAYLERQLLRWRETAKGRDGEWSDLGLRDAASASRHLGYLAETVLSRGNVPRWLRENLSHFVNHHEAAQARRFVALRLSELICFGPQGRQAHRPFRQEESSNTRGANGIQSRLRGFAEREQQDPEERDDHQSPHYLGFIRPFLSHLEWLKTAPGGARKPQAGDRELAHLASTLGVGGEGADPRKG